MALFPTAERRSRQKYCPPKRSGWNVPGPAHQRAITRPRACPPPHPRSSRRVLDSRPQSPARRGRETQASSVRVWNRTFRKRKRLRATQLTKSRGTNAASNHSGPLVFFHSLINLLREQPRRNEEHEGRIE